MQSFSEKIQKHVSSLIIVALLFSSATALFTPRRSSAALATEAPNLAIVANPPAIAGEDAISAAANAVTAEKQTDDWVTKWIINPLVDAIAAALIWQMFDSINSWIQNGFDGKPLFLVQCDRGVWSVFEGVPIPDGLGNPKRWLNPVSDFGSRWR